MDCLVFLLIIEVLIPSSGGFLLINTVRHFGQHVMNIFGVRYLVPSCIQILGVSESVRFLVGKRFRPSCRHHDAQIALTACALLMTLDGGFLQEVMVKKLLSL